MPIIDPIGRIGLRSVIAWKRGGYRNAREEHEEKRELHAKVRVI